MDPAIIAAIVAGALAAVAVLSGLRVVREHERAVVLRLGRLGPLLSPGLRLVLPLGIDRLTRVDLRSAALRMPAHEAITADGVPVRVTATMHLQVVNPVLAATRAIDHVASATQLAEAAVRDVVARTSLRALLTEPEPVRAVLARFVDERAQALGVAITAIDLIEVDLPPGLRTAMAEQSRRLQERLTSPPSSTDPTGPEMDAARRLLDAVVELQGRGGGRGESQRTDAPEDEAAGPVAGAGG